MPRYPDATRVADARQAYFEAARFPPDGGYQEDWVKLKVGPIPIVFPNTASRKANVARHDLHHVATGYDTDLAGEAEIGAWELATGCWHVRSAWLLNMLVLWPVLFFGAGRVYRAFLRGRYSRNFYDDTPVEQVLEKDVGALRARLGLAATPPEATRADKLAFAGLVARVAGIQLAIGSLVIGLPLWLLFG